MAHIQENLLKIADNEEKEEGIIFDSDDSDDDSKQKKVETAEETSDIGQSGQELV